MKKNKNIQYLLVVLVVAIWGAVAFQFSNFQQDTSVGYDIGAELPFRPLTDSSALETFVLQVDYKDPFLGRMNKRPASRKKQVKPLPKRSKKSAAKKTVTPVIRYKGYSLNNKRIQRVSLSVDGRMKSYTTGEQDGKLTLLEMQKDSVVVLWGEVRKTIFRK